MSWKRPLLAFCRAIRVPECHESASDAAALWGGRPADPRWRWPERPGLDRAPSRHTAAPRTPEPSSFSDLSRRRRRRLGLRNRRRVARFMTWGRSRFTAHVANTAISHHYRSASILNRPLLYRWPSAGAQPRLIGAVHTFCLPPSLPFLQISKKTIKWSAYVSCAF